MSSDEVGACIVRAPRRDDAAALGVLHNLVWRHAYAGLMPDEYLTSRNDVAAGKRWHRVIEELDDEGCAPDGRRTLIAVLDDDVLGFMTVGPARRPEHVGANELMALYVHPHHHGRGVAQALTREAFADPAFTDRMIVLWVLEGNERAARFYGKLGFERQQRWTTHEPTGAREQLMVRRAGPAL